MVGLIALGVFILLGVVALWVKGIDEMHEKHPDYKGEDLFGEETKLQCKDCNDNLTDCTCIEDTVDMKQETREYDLLQHIKFCLECKNESQAIRLIEKYGFQKQEESYSEEDMREAIMFGANGMYGWQMGEEGYTDNQIKRFLKTFKKK